MLQQCGYCMSETRRVFSQPRRRSGAMLREVEQLRLREVRDPNYSQH